MIPPLLLLLAAAGADPAQPVDFDTEIIPVLTKSGCNAGSCHGAAAGRGGFRLSLFGGDPAADHDAIVQELEGRRVNLVKPDRSLVLAKPTDTIRHGGGQRLDPDGAGVQRITAWIAAGARRAARPRQLTAFAVEPASRIVQRDGETVPLRAKARFDGGPAVDVTAWTVFAAADPSAVEFAAGSGVATVRRRGQHVVIARFLDRVVPIRLTRPLTDVPVDLARERRANFIDEEVIRNLEVLRVPVSPRADDVTFLRRLRLDLTGRLPTPEEIDRFLADRSGDARAKKIDELLASDDFIEYRTHRLATLYRNRPVGDAAGARALHDWLRQQVRAGTPADRLARDLLVAVGDSHTYGPANFPRLSTDARQQAELVGSAFLGVRIGCANCHNHPLDRWTQDDYHGLAAIFARLERGREVRVGARGAVTHPRTGEPAVARLPAARFLEPAADHRATLADWLTAPDNSYFARATVNRLWRDMFGRGLVEPVDDLRDTNPATHPELLDRLAADFVRHGHDVRHTLRLIARSETYNRSADAVPGNQADDRYYARAYSRPLEPEVLTDALGDVTGVPEQYGEEPVGTRAISLVDPKTPSRALDILGRCSRADACEPGTARAGLPAVLHRLNGELVNRKVTARDGRLHRLIAAGKSNDEIIAEFYPRAFGRPPTDAERRFWQSRAERITPTERTGWLEDMLWSLLNSREFTTNH